MTADDGITEDGPLAATALNVQAGEWLRQVRKDRNASAPKFARSLEAILKVKITAPALYAWETGKRTVPAVVMLAASRVTGEPIALDAPGRTTLKSEVIAEVLRELRRGQQGE